MDPTSSAFVTMLGGVVFLVVLGLLAVPLVRWNKTAILIGVAGVVLVGAAVFMLILPVHYQGGMCGVAAGAFGHTPPGSGTDLDAHHGCAAAQSRGFTVSAWMAAAGVALAVVASLMRPPRTPDRELLAY